jgi:hypothetical protein
MTEMPVMAESTLTIDSFCLPLFRVFQAHPGLNIRKGGKQIYSRDQKISGVFFAMAEKTPDVLLCAVNGETTVSADRFLPDIFCTIDPWHGSIVQNRFGAASRRRGKNDNKPMRPWLMVVVFCIVGSVGRTVRHSTWAT